MTKQQFTAHLKQNEHRLIIFGCGFFGIRLAKTFAANKITPICFCDNNTERIGEYIENIQIRSVADIAENYTNPIFIISPYEKEPQDAIITQLKNASGFQTLEFYTLKHFFAHIELIYFESVLEKLAYRRYIMSEQMKIDPTILYTPAVDLVVTERCSLKCKDCSNLMQYFEHPIDYQMQDLFTEIDRIDLFFDCIGELRILGGEPFMHKGIYDLIEYAQTKTSTTRVVIYTNATIPPNKEKLKKLQANTLYFRLTQYGDLSKQITAWISVLEELGIEYIHQISTTWMDCGQVKQYHRSKEELANIYDRCCILGSTSLIDGKLFRCPYASSLYKLQAMPKEQMDFVDLSDTTKTKEEIRTELKRLIYQIPYIMACDFCNGRTPGTTPSIPAAIQTKNPLPYIKYEI